MTELGILSVQDLATGVRSGELTALDIVEDCLGPQTEEESAHGQGH